MKDLFIVDNFLDDREFRNYVVKFLDTKGFSLVVIDDVRLADDDDSNTNDFLVKKDDVIYTVQTFLNVNVGIKAVDDTVQDINDEHVVSGIIVTNTIIQKEIKEYAKEHLIDVFDRKDLKNLTNQK